ncbi:MAG: hypothetical protein ABWY49_12935, partial [Rhizobium sp.]
MRPLILVVAPAFVAQSIGRDSHRLAIVPTAGPPNSAVAGDSFRLVAPPAIAFVHRPMVWCAPASATASFGFHMFDIFWRCLAIGIGATILM